MIKTKRVYDKPEADDGLRFLVDRLWPRGIKKEDLIMDDWLKKVAPSTELRKWFHKDIEKFGEFRVRYFNELESKPESWIKLENAARESNVTLLYASRNQEHNHAIVLKEYLEKKLEISGMNNR